MTRSRPRWARATAWPGRNAHEKAHVPAPAAHLLCAALLTLCCLLLTLTNNLSAVQMAHSV